MRHRHQAACARRLGVRGDGVGRGAAGGVGGRHEV